jgi:hypothetical protein
MNQGGKDDEISMEKVERKSPGVVGLFLAVMHAMVAMKGRDIRTGCPLL